GDTQACRESADRILKRYGSSDGEHRRRAECWKTKSIVLQTQKDMFEINKKLEEIKHDGKDQVRKRLSEGEGRQLLLDAMGGGVSKKDMRDLADPLLGVDETRLEMLLSKARFQATLAHGLPSDCDNP